MHHSSAENDISSSLEEQGKFIAPENLLPFLKNTEAMRAFAVAIRNFMFVSFGFRDLGYLHYLEVQLLGTVNVLLKKSFNNAQLSDDFFKKLAKKLIKPFLQPEQNDQFIRMFLQKIPGWAINDYKIPSVMIENNNIMVSSFLIKTTACAHDALSAYSRQCAEQKPKIYVYAEGMLRTSISANLTRVEDLLPPLMKEAKSIVATLRKEHSARIRTPDYYLATYKRGGLASLFLILPITLFVSFIFLRNVPLQEYQIGPAIIGCVIFCILVTLSIKHLEAKFILKNFGIYEDAMACILNGIILHHLETSIVKDAAAQNEIPLTSISLKKTSSRYASSSTEYRTDRYQYQAIPDLKRLKPKKSKKSLIQIECEDLIKKHKEDNEAVLQKLLKTQGKTLYFSILHANEYLPCRYEPFALYTPITEPYVVSELWSDAVGRKSMNYTHLMIWHRAEMKKAFKKIERRSTTLHDDFLEAHVYAHIVNAQGYSGFVSCPEYDEAIDGNPVSFKLKLLSDLYRVPYTEQKADAITWTNSTEKDIRKVHYATGVNKVH